MAPSPENDSAPKAPDKTSDKLKGDGSEGAQMECSTADGDNKDASVSRLDDKELKALLDEAINYKSPKDRQGKSRLFNNLLTEAEDDLRNARATSASGPQLARYYNQSASKRHRNRRQASSVSENLTHGGSLNNLAKEELYEAATHLQKPKKTVSARQREGGSLPCNVNVGASYDKQFFEEARNKDKQKSTTTYPIEMDPERMLDQELLIASDIEGDFRVASKYLKNTKIHEPYMTTSAITTLEKAPKIIDSDFPKSVSYEPFAKLNGPFPAFSCRKDDKKVVDENCNALGVGLGQKKKFKKKPMEKNVNVFTATEISGHRSDIINDVDKLIDFIAGNDSVQNGQKLKSTVQKSKIHKNIFDEGKNSRKQRTRSKGKGCTNLQKSNSLEEMTTTTLEDFEFLQEDGKVALRQTKSNTDKPRERRSWGNSEQIQAQSLYNVSIENLETADFRVVTKKKKSKKRRSSLSSRRQTYSREEHVQDFNRVPSPEPRRKSAISVPHSEKSNDSSDVDSVHSLPIDTNRMKRDREEEDSVNFPISYADIAKNNGNQLDKPKLNRPNNDQKKLLEKNPIDAKTVTPLPHDCEANKNEVLVDKTYNKKKSPDDKGKGVVKQTTIDPPQSQQIVPKTQDKATSVFEDKAAIIPVTKDLSPELNLVDYMVNFPSIPSKDRNSMSDQDHVRNIVAEIQNWPPIPSNNNYNISTFDKNNTRNQQKNQRNLTNHFKNAKNIAGHKNMKHQAHIGSGDAKIHNIIYANEAQMIQNNERPINVIYNRQNMPLNIQDVRTIEKHFKNQPKPIFFHNQFFCQFQKYPNEDVPLLHLQQHHHHHHHQLQQSQNLQQQLSPPVKEAALPSVINSFNCSGDNIANGIINSNSVQCEVDFTSDMASCYTDAVVSNTDCDRTTISNSSNNNNTNSSNNRPAVVILSGNGEKEVSGITFGFDINEQLLSDDVSADFMARFVPPKDCDIENGFNFDKIVNFIGGAWQDIVREANGHSVKFYTEEL